MTGPTVAEQLVTSDTFNWRVRPPRKCVQMLTWIVPAVSLIMQLGIFFAAAAALVAGMLGIR